jgi:formate dehydrogenase major subunit
MREINGFETASGKHLTGFDKLADDGSTTCASWIYCGIFPDPDHLRAANRTPDPAGGSAANLEWGYSWPANRRILYNRASARPDGAPWSDRKKWVWWDGAKWALSAPRPVAKAPGGCEAGGAGSTRTGLARS